jgi:hypothetical protein
LSNRTHPPSFSSSGFSSSGRPASSSSGFSPSGVQ